MMVIALIPFPQYNIIVVAVIALLQFILTISSSSSITNQQKSNSSRNVVLRIVDSIRFTRHGTSRYTVCSLPYPLNNTHPGMCGQNGETGIPYTVQLNIFHPVSDCLLPPSPFLFSTFLRRFIRFRSSFSRRILFQWSNYFVSLSLIPI